MKKIILNKGREHSLLRKHPWVFSGAIARSDKGISSGETVSVLSDSGQCLGVGAYSPISQIRVRMWSFREEETIDEHFFKGRIQSAVDLRHVFASLKNTNALRLVCSEADGLSGLIVDRYDTILVCQFLSAGTERWKKEIVENLKSITGIRDIYERSEASVRKKEGLNCVQGVLSGNMPSDLVLIRENGVHFFVDVLQGHKTGFYLDQRDNRLSVQDHAQHKDVLNCFSYSGGFGLSALKGGAKHVINIEDNASLVALAEKQCELNHFEKERYLNVKGDVFQILRQYIKDGKTFDVVILDPPKFAESKSQLHGACRGYKDINLLACKLLRPGGFLFTFSCSGLMKMDLFHKIVADAAIDASKNMQLLRWLSQSMDHPIKIEIPETLYLKGLLTRMS